jgi:hypothetical protein
MEEAGCSPDVLHMIKGIGRCTNFINNENVRVVPDAIRLTLVDALRDDRLIRNKTSRMNDSSSRKGCVSEGLL